MSAEIKKSSAVVSYEMHRGLGQTICQTDVIVPDSMPDAIKILKIEGHSVIQSSMITEGKVSVRGSIQCNILYVPESAKGVKSIDCEMPFSYTETIEDVTEDMVLEVKSKVSHMEYQLVNSRKISIKAICELEKSITSNEEIVYICSVEGEGVETRETKLKARKRVLTKEVPVVVSENVPMPKNMDAVLQCDGEISSKDVKIINNKVVAKGEIKFKILYLNGEDMPQCSSFGIPFTEIIDAEGINDKQITKVSYHIDKTNATAVAGEEGTDLKCECMMKVLIMAEQIVEFEAVKDLYGTKSRLVPEMKKITLNEKSNEVSSYIDIKEIVSTAEDMPPIEKVYKMNTTPYVNSATPGKSGIKVEGNCVCSVTYISNKEDNALQTVTFTLPFSGLIPGDFSGAERVCADAYTQKEEYGVSGNSIEIRVNLELSGYGINNNETYVVTDVREEEENMADMPAMVLYFVQKGDTVWEIAKRYHSKICEIEQINKIDEDDIKEGMMLLIPKK